MPKRPKWRLAPDDIPEDLRYEGEYLVRPSSGEAVRMLRECEVVTSSGFRECGYLSSVRLLFAGVMASAAIFVPFTGKPVAGSSTVECQVCNAQILLSVASWPLFMGLWLSKSLEKLKGEGISISWRVEQLDTVGRNAGRAPRASSIRSIGGSRP